MQTGSAQFSWTHTEKSHHFACFCCVSVSMWLVLLLDLGSGDLRAKKKHIYERVFGWLAIKLGIYVVVCHWKWRWSDQVLLLYRSLFIYLKWSSFLQSHKQQRQRRRRRSRTRHNATRNKTLHSTTMTDGRIQKPIDRHLINALLVRVCLCLSQTYLSNRIRLSDVAITRLC